MPRLTQRQPRTPRTIVSVSVHIEPDYTRLARAAGMQGQTIAEFVREAMRHRVNRVLGKDDQKVQEPAASNAA